RRVRVARHAEGARYLHAGKLTLFLRAYLGIAAFWRKWRVSRYAKLATRQTVDPRPPRPVAARARRPRLGGTAVDPVVVLPAWAAPGRRGRDRGVGRPRGAPGSARRSRLAPHPRGARRGRVRQGRH